MEFRNNKFNFIFRKQKLKVLLLASLLIVNIFFSLFIQQSNNFVLQNDQKKDIKISSEEITINTPYNITYRNPDEGYYPGTFSFDNDIIGSHPNSWISNAFPSPISVVSELDNHNTIMRIWDHSDMALIHSEYYFPTPPSYGTVEFWVYTISQVDVHYLSLDSFSIHLGNVFAYEYSPGNYNFFRQADTRTWYHVRIDFETTTGGYMGLSQYMWRVYINGEEFGDYAFIYDIKPDRLRFQMDDVSVGEYYIDAVGFSWDPNYNIGDNINEGLLLNFTNPTQLDAMGYFLDGQLINTILGNTTIPFPEDGPHTIQVIGVDNSGLFYSSNIRQFRIDTLAPEILAPSEIIYEEGATGNTISWSVSDASPKNYTIKRDGNPIDDGEWISESPISISVDSLSDSTYTYTLEVDDEVGNSNSNDVSVIVLPSVDPEISHPEDISFETGETGNILTWTATDLYPDTYIITYQGYNSQPIPWSSGVPISFPLDSLPEGNYVVTITITDEAGNNAIDTVNVEVTGNPDDEPSIPGYDLLLLLGIIGISIILMFPKKKYNFSN